MRCSNGSRAGALGRSQGSVSGWTVRGSRGYGTPRGSSAPAAEGREEADSVEVRGVGHRFAEARTVSFTKPRCAAGRAGTPTVPSRPPWAHPSPSVPGTRLTKAQRLTLKLVFFPLHHSCFPWAQTLLKTPLFHFNQTNFHHGSGL